jgi:16S rRNA (uracil1498-N3)-methyltransferase
VERCERSERSREAWVLCGPPEGERGDWMIEKLAELGVAVLQPIDCERGGWDRMKGRAERWRRLAVAALRQSRRRFLLEILEPLPLAEALAGLPAGGGRWLGDAAGPAAATIAPAGSGLSVGLLGPAAGFSPSEREAAGRGGFSAMCLSDSRLRTETAALAWACWWSAAVSGASDAVAGGDRA